MNATAAGKTPVHLWIVGILSLLWGCIGANDYYQSQTNNMAYLQMMGMGQPELDWMHAMPVWLTASWAIGVWVGLLGSILLLARSRYAYHAFALSFAGIVITMVAQYLTPHPASFDTAMTLAISAAVVAIGVAMLLYSRAQAKAGVLR
jgi:hypothetical protein